MKEILLDFLAEKYLWVKALHLGAVICWMAGLFYLPRLFVYHTGAPVGSQQSETFKIMERRLEKIIIIPAMTASFLLGGLLMATPGLLSPPRGWFHLKLALVLLLAGFHGFLSKCRKAFEVDQNKRSEKFFRVLNEIPPLLMILIIFLVVLKPF